MKGLMPTAVNATAASKFLGKHQVDSALKSISSRKQLLGIDLTQQDHLELHQP